MTTVLSAQAPTSITQNPLVGKVSKESVANRAFGRDITNNKQKQDRTRKNKRTISSLDDGHYVHAEPVKRRRIECAKTTKSIEATCQKDASKSTEKAVSPAKTKCSPKKDKLCILAACDEDNEDNELACTEYIEDIFHNLRKRESNISNYMKKQSDINSTMRSILLDWIVGCHQKFRLVTPTLHLSVQLLDRFLAARDVKRTDLQILASACLWVASKYHDIYAPHIAEFLYVSDRAFSQRELLQMEVELVSTLKFNVACVCPLTFLERYITVFTSNMRSQHKRITSSLMMMFLEEALLTYETAIMKPSLLAAAVVAIAFGSIVNDFVWTPKFVSYTGYEFKALIPAIKHLDACHRRMMKSGSKHLRGLRKKFSRTKYNNVALFKLRALPFDLSCQ